MTDIFSNSLPLTLNAVLVFHVPWYTWLVPSMVVPVATPRGERIDTEIHVTNNLLDYVEAHALPKDLGGSLTFKHKEWLADRLVKCEMKF